ncbi:unnamed protein product, partial [Prorocentrum cordatum]
AEPRPKAVREALRDEDEDGATHAPLSECLAAALKAKGLVLSCPDPFIPCPACKAGETSWSFQLGVGVVAYLLLEALKAALRLAGGQGQPSAQQLLMAGSFHCVRYRVPWPVFWHETLTTAERGALSYILTPDFDDYDEPNAPGPDVAEVVRLAGQGCNHPALAAVRVCCFGRFPTAAEALGAVWRAVAAGYPPPPEGPLMLDLAAGNILGVAAWQRPLANPAAGAALGGAAPAGAAGAPGALAAPGALVAVPGAAAPAAAGAAGVGLAGLVAAPVPARGRRRPQARRRPRGLWLLPPRRCLRPGPLRARRPPPPEQLPRLRQRPDLRALAAARDGRGQRRLDFREGVLAQSEHAWADFPVRGPRTTHWVLQCIQQRGGSPRARHSRWLTEVGLDPDDAGVEMHLLCCRLLETMISHDQFSACDLASAELIARTLQMQVRGDVCIAPVLQQYVSAELTREVVIQKELRRAREERQLASGAPGSNDKDKKGKKGEKGKGSVCARWWPGTRPPPTMALKGCRAHPASRRSAATSDVEKFLMGDVAIYFIHLFSTPSLPYLLLALRRALCVVAFSVASMTSSSLE